ncbi:MAG: PAS domain-containing protein, partial [Halohasta sp.]
MSELIPPAVAGDELEQVRQERDFWKSMFDSLVGGLPEPALVLNAEGVVTHWNSEAVGLTGVDAETAVGTHVQEFAEVDDGEERAAATALREGRAVRETEVRAGRQPTG